MQEREGFHSAGIFFDFAAAPYDSPLSGVIESLGQDQPQRRDIFQIGRRKGLTQFTVSVYSPGLCMNEKNNILVAYFSNSGNTRVIAYQIHEIVDGVIFEILTVDPYPKDYNEVVEQARKELGKGYRPELKTTVENLVQYNTVFIGYPNWCGTIPMPVATFLSKNDFSGKNIVPFCTHEGSALGRSAGSISELCPRSIILDGLAVRGRNVKNAKEDVLDWLRKIGMIE
jgi:flavodoxin